MAHLSIQDYDERERAARADAPSPAIRAFAPLAFDQVNFPTRVAEERELIRFADIMYEFLPRLEWLEQKGYSELEAAAICQLSDQIRVLTRSLFGRPVQPLMCLFPPIPILRAIETIAQARGRRLRVFEIGPGSGHLGAYLLNRGHRYAAMDVCQSLYLWQNRLFQHVAPDFVDWVGDPGAARRVGFQAQATHLPWWEFARFHESLPLHADVVVCDAALGEMDVFAFWYVLRVARSMLAGSDCGCFMFQNLGEERFNRRADLVARFRQLGLTGREIGGVSVFSAATILDGVFGETLAPLGGPDAALSPPKAFLRFDPSELLPSYRFFEFIGLS
jgi:hypothetical protein